MMRRGTKDPLRRVLASSQVDTWIRRQHDASDIVQQTMLDAMARRDQFHGATEGEFMAWLRKILTNNLIDAIRHHKRAKRDISRNLSLEEEISQSSSRLKPIRHPKPGLYPLQMLLQDLHLFHVSEQYFQVRQWMHPAPSLQRRQVQPRR